MTGKQVLYHFKAFTHDAPYLITTELKKHRYYYVRYYKTNKFTNVWALDFDKNYNIEVFKLNNGETKEIKYQGITNTYLVFQGECEMNNTSLTSLKFYRKVRKEDIILKATIDNTYVAKLIQII